MKKIFVPAAIALLMAFGASDASAQEKKSNADLGPVKGVDSESPRPIPSNDARTPDKGAEITNGRPLEQIRVNETESQRNRNHPQADYGEMPTKATQTSPANDETKPDNHTDRKTSKYRDRNRP